MEQQLERLRADLSFKDEEVQQASRAQKKLQAANERKRKEEEIKKQAQKEVLELRSPIAR